jgi:hypothetical protein
MANRKDFAGYQVLEESEKTAGRAGRKSRFPAAPRASELPAEVGIMSRFHNS